MQLSYRHEKLVLLLVAVTALSFVHYISAQDTSRLASPNPSSSTARFGSTAGMTTPSTRPSSGHYYSDKAPGVSFLAAPSFALMRELGLVDEASARNGVWNEQPLLWLLRVLTGARISRCGSACWTYGRIDRRRHGRCHRAGVRTGNTGRAFRRDGLRTRARSRTRFWLLRRSMERNDRQAKCMALRRRCVQWTRLCRRIPGRSNRGRLPLCGRQRGSWGARLRM